MTPKEKAEKLVNSFIGLSSNKLSDYSRIEHPTAKQCAILVVDEILKRIVPKDDDERYVFELCGNQFYWQEVKKEIELL